MLNTYTVPCLFVYSVEKSHYYIYTTTQALDLTKRDVSQLDLPDINGKLR